MIAKVTPITRLPSNIDVFDYLVPQELEKTAQIGQIVKIPLRNKESLGVILDLPAQSAQNNKTFRARPIKSIFDNDPILTREQFKLMDKFSEYYYMNKGAAARIIIPSPLLINKQTKPNKQQQKISFTIEKNQLPKLENFYKNLDLKKNQNILCQDFSSWLWFMVKILSENKFSSYLIILPTINWIKAVGEVLSKKFGQNVCAIHSELNKSSYWHAYKKIQSKKAKIILSTRQAAFLPLPKKSFICFFDYTCENFKQSQQYPRYDSRLVGEWLSQITDSALFNFSSSILIDKPNLFKKLPPSTTNKKIGIHVIDMKKEMQQKEFSIIPQNIIESVNTAKNNNKKSIFLSLRSNKEQGGVNLDKISETLTKQIKYCKILKYNQNYKIADNFDILLITPSALESLKLSEFKGKIQNIIITSIEPLMSLPDYKSGQRTLEKLKHWQMLCQEIQVKDMYLLSYSPQAEIIQSFASQKEETYIKQELENRKKLLYPPYSKLIKILYKGSDIDKLTQLKQELSKAHKDDIKILGPRENYLLIKILKPINLNALTSLSTEWIIDREPDNVL